MNAVVDSAIVDPLVRIDATGRSRGVWTHAWKRLRQDHLGVACLIVVGLFVLMIIGTATGIVVSQWGREVALPYAPPSFVGKDSGDTLSVDASGNELLSIDDIDPLGPKKAEIERMTEKNRQIETPRLATLPFGADRRGRDVVAKAVKGAQVSISVGVAAALIATLIGTVLGGLAGYFGGLVGDLLEWVYNVFTAVPSILLIFAFAAVLGPGIGSVVTILGLTGWTGIYRLVRAEYIKHRSREYVLAATAIGASDASRMFVHILPNISHVVLVQLSLLVVAFIKSEVILSFLGLGVPVDSVSWGTMLNEAQAELILGKWWQLIAATAFMAVFVTAFSLMTDAVRDALDPKLR